jgi:hypothetical protein
MELGGGLECDFVRDPESSYNPRPARIAYILAVNADTKDASQLATGMLGTVPAASLKADDFPNTEPKTSKDEALAAIEFLQNGTEIGEDAALAATALWLDRIRHIHLAPEEKRRALGALIPTRHPQVIKLAENYAPALAKLLVNWKASRSIAGPVEGPS